MQCLQSAITLMAIQGTQKSHRWKDFRMDGVCPFENFNPEETHCYHYIKRI